MAKKTLLITTFVLLLICSNLLGDARYIQITACTYEGPVFNDGPEGCKIYFNTLNNGYVYIVKYDEFVNPPYVYDIAYITFDETDYFAEWGVDDSLYFTDIEVGELDPDLQEVVPLDDEEWSDDELNQVWGKGYLHGIYPSQLWYVDGSDIIQESSATIEFYGMGNPPWFDYEYRTTYLSASGCNWVSFPVLDPDWADPVEHVLAPILDEQVYVKHEKDWIYQDQAGNWHNDIGDFHSIDGYMIWINNDAELEVAGFWAGHPDNPDIEIPLYEGEDNWIGCFLQEPLSVYDAFASVWDYIECIKSKHWGICIQHYDIPHMRWTVNPGELYVVTVNQDCYLFWGTGEPIPPYVKQETEFFTYTETSDYEPILVDTVYGEQPEEIGVFIDNECIGASKLEDGFPLFVPAYIEDDTTRDEDYELTFQIYIGNRNESTQVNGVEVYDSVISAFVDRPIYLDEDDCAVVRLNTKGAPEISREFALYQNYPNPMGTSTTISFSLHRGDTKDAEINIYNIKGQLVSKFQIPNDKYQINEVVWDGRDDNGNQVPTGIYFYKLISGEKTAVKKMVILR